MASPNAVSLITLPPEILDLVASHVWKKEYLMQLALTHPLLCDVVIPRHLYRQIRVRLPDSRRWSHLLVDPQRLRSIRSLCIISTTSWHVSGHLVLTKGRESLFNAIAEMQGLKRLAVSHQPNPTMYQTKAFDGLFWEAVARVCLAMEDFYFTGGWNCLNCYETAFGKSESNIWTLSSLVSADLNLRCCPSERPRHNYDFSPVHRMLLRCPALKRLSLNYDDRHSNTLDIPEFLTLRFSYLETLRLTSIAFGVNTPSLLSSFISANPSIIDLQYLPSTDLTLNPNSPPCSKDVLNRLTSLEGSLRTCERLVGATIPTRLKHLSMTLDTEELGALMEFICWPGPFLEKLRLYFRDQGPFDWVLLTSSIRSSCTQLRQLSIQQRKSYGHFDSLRILSISDVASTLTEYQELSVFDIPWFISVLCGLSYHRDFDSVNRTERLGAVFSMKLKWPRFVRTADPGEKAIVVFGSNPTEMEKYDLKIKIRPHVDYQNSGQAEKWMVWRYDECEDDEY